MTVLTINYRRGRASPVARCSTFLVPALWRHKMSHWKSEIMCCGLQSNVISAVHRLSYTHGGPKRKSCCRIK